MRTTRWGDSTASIARWIRMHFAAAAAFGLLAGLLDAAQQFVLRADPVTLASRKVGSDILWAGPATALAFAIALAVVSLPVVLLLGQFRANWPPRVTYATFAALTTWLALASTERISQGAINVLTAAVVLRILTASDASIIKLGRLTPRAAAMLLAVVGLSYGGALGWQHLQRWRMESRLPVASSASPNVLLVVLDTFRWDLLFGPGRDTLMPNLTRLAARGIVFRDAWATSSWSLSSQASILSGMYPEEHGADWPQLRYADSVRTLPQRLAQRGYVTGAFSGNFSWVTPEYLGHGFMRFVSYTPKQVLLQTAATRKARNRRWVDDRLIEIPTRSAPQLQEEFLRFVDRYPSRPFFAYICFMDANHALYDTQRRLVGTRTTYPNANEQRQIAAGMIANYERSAIELDRAVGALLDSLERRQRLRNTLVIVTSDHGEAFGRARGRPNAPGGHATSLYPEQSRVPLIVSGAGAPARGIRVNRPVSLRDVAATIGDVVGFKSHGRSLFALLRDSAATPSPVLLSLRYGDRRLRGIVIDRYLYIEEGVAPEAKRQVVILNDPLTSNTRTSRLVTALQDSLAAELRRHRGSMAAENRFQ